MLCLLVRLISRHCVMACAAAQTSPELQFRKMKILRDLSMFGHLLAIQGDRGIEGCKWPSPLDFWEATVTPEQCVLQTMAVLPTGLVQHNQSSFLHPCACELACHIILGIFGKSSTI